MPQEFTKLPKKKERKKTPQDKIPDLARPKN